MFDLLKTVIKNCATGPDGITFDPAMRRQVLTAHFSASGTTYTQGA